MNPTLNLVERLLSRGRRLHEAGRPHDALPVLKRLVRLGCLPPAAAEEAHARLAAIRLGQGRARRARRHLMLALAFSPDTPHYHAELAAAYDHDGLPRKAARHYRQALHLQPDQPAALVAFGRLLVRGGQLDEGLRALRQAAELRPDDPAVLSALADALADDAGDASGAAALLRAARFRHPRDARFQQLWFDFQFRKAAADQEAARRGEPAGDRPAVVLPFVRPVREDGPAPAGAGVVIRLDRASKPASHLPGTARRSDPRRAP